MGTGNRKLIKVIGTCLAVLYAISLWAILLFIKIPEYTTKTGLYSALFLFLLIASVALASFKEWGRKLIVVLNGFMLFCLLIKYVPQIDILPLSYFILSGVIFLYFNQSKVKNQFEGRKIDNWRSVLVIDDDETLIKTIRPILMKSGFSVLTASTGESGLLVAKRQKPDLILLDVILPGLKGRDVCRQLKEDERTKSIPVLFLTAKDSPDDVQAEKEAGARGHITKPFVAKDLVKVLEEVLGN